MSRRCAPSARRSPRQAGRPSSARLPPPGSAPSGRRPRRQLPAAG
ncbi:hypothetical protein ACFFX0_18190 [Citricoccus parietis]|uniref:Uncharacterized protein n=1 Tax=Citricoccus parietis TaxID=592307 RepID=A0ABV5G268_9MICC